MAGLAQLLLAILQVLPSATAGTQCYELSGAATNEYLPCTPQNNQSFCCPDAWICLSNSVCQVGPDAKNPGATDFYKPRCTDPYFQDPACPKYCPNNDGIGIQSCPDLGTGKACCWQGNQDCCANNTLVFDLGISSIVTTIDAVALASELATMTTVLPSSSTPPSAETTQTNAASTSGTESTAASASAAPSASNHADSNNAVPIGVGIGVGLFAGLLAIAGVLFYLLRKRRNSEPQHETQPIYNINDQKAAGHPGGILSSASYFTHPEAELAGDKENSKRSELASAPGRWVAELPDERR